MLVCVLWVNGSDYTWQRVNCVYLTSVELFSADDVLVLYVFLCTEWLTALEDASPGIVSGFYTSPYTGMRKRLMPDACMYDCVCLCLVYLVCECTLLAACLFLCSTFYIMFPVSPTLCLKGVACLASVPIYLACQIISVLLGLLLSSHTAVHKHTHLGKGQ
jgi:hypothetical protein